MKLFLVSLILFSLLASCEKTGDLQYTEMVKGGCFSNTGNPYKGDNPAGENKVTWTFIDGNLNLFTGFNATCCSEYSATPVVRGDSIIVRIVTTKPGTCNCICYYTYNFKFTGSGKNFSYKVTIDNYLVFTGKIN